MKLNFWPFRKKEPKFMLVRTGNVDDFEGESRLLCIDKGFAIYEEKGARSKPKKDDGMLIIDRLEPGQSIFVGLHQITSANAIADGYCANGGQSCFPMNRPCATCPRNRTEKEQS